MPRLLNLRALCAHCERAEAHVWSSNERIALCEKCSHKQKNLSKLPIVSHSVVTALCARCTVAPAAHLVIGPSGETPLCQLCVKAKGYRPLKEARTIERIVFDRMDFSAIYARDKSPLSAKYSNEENDIEKERERIRIEDNNSVPHRVDLSYYKKPVPLSIVHSKKKRNAGSENGDGANEKANGMNQRGKTSRRRHR